MNFITFLINILILFSGAKAVATSIPCNYSGLFESKLNRRVSSSSEYIRMMQSQLQGRSADDGGLPDFHTDVVTGKKIAFSYDRGGIESVNIDCDAMGLIKGTVYYSNIQTGYLYITVTDARYKSVEDIPGMWYTINSGGSLPFEIKLTDTAAVGNFYFTNYLKVSYHESKGVSKGNEVWFDMNKKWRKKLDDENKLFLISLSALGDTSYTNTHQNPENNNLKDKTPISWEQISNVNKKPSRGKGKPPVLVIDLSEKLSVSSIIDHFNIDIQNILYDSISKEYYFYPRQYSLVYDKTASYDRLAMKLSYGSLTDEGGKVSYSIALHSGILAAELELVQTMLRHWLKKPKAILKPIVPESLPVLDLSINGQLGIAADKISIGQMSSLQDILKISFVCDPSLSDDLLTQLEAGFKITGNLSFIFQDRAKSIPIEIAVNEVQTFGAIHPPAISLRSNNPLQSNTLPFPIKYKSLHILQANSYKVVSFSLQSESIPPESKVKINNPELIPAWIEDPDKVSRIWFEYSIDPCKDCFDELISDISSGTAESRRKFIRFQSFYDDYYTLYGAKSMKLLLKSIYIDPRRKELKELITEIKPGQGTTEIGPFYHIKDQDLSYQYKYTLYTEDKSYESDWMPSKGLELYLQKESFDRSFRNKGLIKLK